MVNAGSVENHSGHIFSPNSDMGFWTAFSADPSGEMRKRGYDDVKLLDVPNADPVLAYRTVLWIKTTAYRAFTRNCEDDVYDVLRAYGVRDLTPPSLIWLPKSWFKRFRGEQHHVADFTWPHREPVHQGMPQVARPDDLTPWHPTWRRPWHPDFNLFFWRSFVRRPSN